MRRNINMNKDQKHKIVDFKHLKDVKPEEAAKLVAKAEHDQNAKPQHDQHKQHDAHTETSPEAKAKKHEHAKHEHPNTDKTSPTYNA